MARRSIDIQSIQHSNPIPAATRIGPLVVSSITPPFDPGTRHCPESIDEQIANDEMPLPSYLILHSEAQLSEEDKAALRRWAQANF